MSAADGRLTAYLLGRLSPEDEEGVELEYLRGGEAYERLLAAEDDLIDAYAAGRLDADDVRRFEERFLASPERRERVAFAQALRARARDAEATPRTTRRRSSFLLQAAAVLPIALAVTWLFVSERQLRTQVSNQRLSYSSAQREAAEQQARIAQLEEELASARAGAAVVTWRLQPGFERDATPSAPATVPAGVTIVKLELALGPAAQAGPFRVRVETAETRVVALLEGLRPRDGNGHVVDVFVPAASLAPGTHVVILEAGSPPEPVDTYRFRVAAPRY